jgi:hypothetical protein
VPAAAPPWASTREFGWPSLDRTHFESLTHPFGTLGVLALVEPRLKDTEALFRGASGPRTRALGPTGVPSLATGPDSNWLGPGRLPVPGR